VRRAACQCSTIGACEAQLGSANRIIHSRWQHDQSGYLACQVHSHAGPALVLRVGLLNAAQGSEKERGRGLRVGLLAGWLEGRKGLSSKKQLLSV